MDLCCFCPQSRRPRPRILARREAFRHNAVVDWIDDRDRTRDALARISADVRDDVRSARGLAPPVRRGAGAAAATMGKEPGHLARPARPGPHANPLARGPLADRSRLAAGAAALVVPCRRGPSHRGRPACSTGLGGNALDRSAPDPAPRRRPDRAACLRPRGRGRPRGRQEPDGVDRRGPGDCRPAALVRRPARGSRRLRPCPSRRSVAGISQPQSDASRGPTVSGP